MKPVYLLCGVSGSGKTYVCKQLTDKFEYIPHDLFYQNIVDTLVATARVTTRPIITECPFGERLLREALEGRGLKVIPYFVIENPNVVAKRYEEREGKPLPKNALTRSSRIKDRAVEWRAPYGTSDEILEKLKNVDTNA